MTMIGWNRLKAGEGEATAFIVNYVVLCPRYDIAACFAVRSLEEMILSR